MTTNTVLYNKINYFIVFVACAIPLIINPFGFDYYYLPKISAVYWAVLCIIAISVLNKEKCLKIKDKSEILIFIYFIILFISTLNSLEISISIWGSPEREEGLLAIIAYISLFIFTKRYYKFDKSHLYFFITSSTIVAVYGIMQYFGFDPIPRDYIRGNWNGMAFSTMGNPNFLGSYLTIVLPPIIYCYIVFKKKVFLLISSIIFFGLLCTMTRGAWIGFGVALFVLCVFIFKNKNLRKYLYHILISFFVVIIIFNLISDNEFMGRILSIFGDFRSTLTMESGYKTGGSGRMFIWIKTLSIIKDYPLLGVGIDNLYLGFGDSVGKEIIDTFGYPIIIDKAHNEYLQIAATTGIPSLIIYLLFLREIITKSFLKINKSPIIIPVFASVVGYLVQAFFNISVVSVAYLFWIFLGLLSKYSAME